MKHSCQRSKHSVELRFEDVNLMRVGGEKRSTFAFIRIRIYICLEFQLKIFKLWTLQELFEPIKSQTKVLKVRKYWKKFDEKQTSKVFMHPPHQYTEPFRRTISTIAMKIKRMSNFKKKKKI